MDYSTRESEEAWKILSKNGRDLLEFGVYPLAGASLAFCCRFLHASCFRDLTQRLKESLELWDHKWKAADRLKVFPHIFTGISMHTCSQGPLPCNGTPHVLASVPVLAVGMYKRTTCLSPLLSQDNLYFHNSGGWYWRLRGKKTKTNPWTLRSFVTTGTNTSHRGRTRASFLTISLDYFVLSAA